MKWLLLLLAALSMSLEAQDTTKATNPDGKDPSVHITPFVSSVRKLMDGKDTDGSYDSTFGFDVMLKVPVSNWVTLAMNCSYQDLNWKQNYLYQDKNILRTGNGNIEQNYFKLGLTFSYYFK